MKFIVNADDFGITLGVSRGIIKGMKEGIITDTSALVNSKDFEESAKLAKEAGITSMGVHLTITFLEPVLDKSMIKSIIDENGKFFRKPNLIPKNYKKEEVKAELKAQIEKFLKAGLKLNHLDSHHGISVLDAEVFDIVLELGREYNVPIRREDTVARDAEIKGKFLGSGAKGADYLCADFSSLAVREEYVMEILEKYKGTDSIYEFGGHPGFVDEELKAITSFADERENDLAVFMSEKVMNYIKDNNIELISYSFLI